MRNATSPHAFPTQEASESSNGPRPPLHQQPPRRLSSAIATAAAAAVSSVNRYHVDAILDSLMSSSGMLLRVAGSPLAAAATAGPADPSSPFDTLAAPRASAVAEVISRYLPPNGTVPDLETAAASPDQRASWPYHSDSGAGSRGNSAPAEAPYADITQRDGFTASSMAGAALGIPHMHASAVHRETVSSVLGQLNVVERQLLGAQVRQLGRLLRSSWSVAAYVNYLQQRAPQP